MATNYPTSLDTYTDTASTESVGAAGGGQGVSVILNNAQDAIEALQAKVGVDSSAVATSLDYRVATLEGATAAGDVTGPASSTDNNIAVYNGATGKIIKDGGNTVAGVLSRANHTGTQTASTISDFDTEVANNSAVTANTAKVTNATHTGEVTGSTALTVADNVIDEANLKLDTAPTNDYVLTADSTASGGMKWAEAAAGGGATTNNARGDSSSTFSTTSASLVDVTSCSATLTTTGGNVLVSISVRAIAVNTAPVNAEMAIDYDGTGNVIPGGNTNVRLLDTGFFNFSYTFIHTSVTAASHTWKLQLKSDGTKQITIYNAVINVIEL